MLLEQVQNGAATLENIWEFLLRLYIDHMTQQSHSWVFTVEK